MRYGLLDDQVDQGVANTANLGGTEIAWAADGYPSGGLKKAAFD
jgi:hypothetical protein